MGQGTAHFARVIWIVLDSVGIGELPDAADYGDVGRDTLGHIARSRPLHLPNLVRLGLANIKPLDHLAPPAHPSGSYGKGATRSPGKDTTTGHWVSPARLPITGKSAYCVCLLRAIRWSAGPAPPAAAAAGRACSRRSPCRARPAPCAACTRSAPPSVAPAPPGSGSPAAAPIEGSQRGSQSMSCCTPNTVLHILYITQCTMSSSFEGFFLGSGIQDLRRSRSGGIWRALVTGLSLPPPPISANKIPTFIGLEGEIRDKSPRLSRL